MNTDRMSCQNADSLITIFGACLMGMTMYAGAPPLRATARNERGHAIFRVKSAPALLTGGLAMVPFLIARQFLRLTNLPSESRVRGLDPETMTWCGFVLAAVAPAGFIVSAPVGFCFAVAMVVAWFGFRLDIRIAADRSVVTRKFLFIVPWSRHVHRDPPSSFVDGWGDFSDPEALHIAWEEQSIELAWGDKFSGDACERWAERICALSHVGANELYRVK